MNCNVRPWTHILNENTFLFFSSFFCVCVEFYIFYVPFQKLKGLLPTSYHFLLWRSFLAIFFSPPFSLWLWSISPGGTRITRDFWQPLRLYRQLRGGFEFHFSFFFCVPNLHFPSQKNDHITHTRCFWNYTFFFTIKNPLKRGPPLFFCVCGGGVSVSFCPPPSPPLFFSSLCCSGFHQLVLKKPPWKIYSAAFGPCVLFLMLCFSCIFTPISYTSLSSLSVLLVHCSTFFIVWCRFDLWSSKNALRITATKSSGHRIIYESTCLGLGDFCLLLSSFSLLLFLLVYWYLSTFLLCLPVW